MLAPEHLPPQAVELAEAIGLPATLRLVDGWGGLRLYVPEPRHLHPEHRLVRALGIDGARALAARYAREKIDIPRCTAAVRAARDAEIRARHAEGESGRALAAAYGLTERHVWRILSEAEADDRQQALL